MARIDGNGGEKDLQALKAYYEALNARKTGKEEKAEEVKPTINLTPKKVEASALDLTAAQILGAQFTQVDKSDSATLKRLEKGFTNAPFMATLDDLQGIKSKNVFVSYAMQNLKGCDPDKLQKYMNKGLDQGTTSQVVDFIDTLTV